MDFSISAPPTVPLERVIEHLARAYGLTGDFHALDAERDQNFKISAGKGAYLLKVCAADEGFALAEAQALALQHIAFTDPSLPVPRVNLTKSGGPLSVLNHEDKDFAVMLLDWLPGEVLADRATSHLTELGSLSARLGKAMQGFASPAIVGRDLLWNVMDANRLLPAIKLLPQARHKQAQALLDFFSQETRPQLRRLRAQCIHGDLHPFNVVLGSEGAISGLIDFGDMIHAPLIIDVANTIADCLTAKSDVAHVFESLLASYNAVLPLEREEALAIVPLVKTRLLSSTLISLLRISHGLGQTTTIESLSKESLKALDSVEQDTQGLTDLCLHVTGHAAPTKVTPPSLMQRRVDAMGPKPLLFYSKPLHMVRGAGVWLEADDGRRYLDCYNNVAHVGHAHPVVAAAVARQLRVLNTNTRYLTDQSIAYAEALKATLHPSLNTVIFVNSGSEANDVAWRMAKVFTGHGGALCMDFAYHGVTTISDAFSPSNYPEGKWNFPFVRQLPAPDIYRGEHSNGEAFAALADEPIADLQREGYGIALAILDSAFMTNGILDAPAGYVQGVVDRVHRAGGVFVADEVQSGFGRMGSHMWGHQRHGVVPDFVTIGKPAGNGYPIGAIITRSEILERFVAETGPFFSTFGGGNAACSAGLAVLDVMQRDALVCNAAETGAGFIQSLRNLMQRHEIIGDVRGMGLAIGVELVTNRAAKLPARAETRKVLDLMRDAGVLIGSDGKHGNVLKLRPPLVFRKDHAAQVVSTLDRVLGQLG